MKRKCLLSVRLKLILLILPVSFFCVQRLPAQKALPQSPDDVQSTYLLGPNDEITIRTSDIEDHETKVRIPANGYVSLPMLGQVKASGLTVDQFEVAIAERLKKYIRKPQVSVHIMEFHSQPVSVIGAVKNPGVHQLEGRKTLVEMLSSAGGLREDAGHTVNITRRSEWGAIPLPMSIDRQTGFYVAEVEIKALIEARDAAVNIDVKPYDVISVPRSEMVYVVGEVKKSGGFLLGERESISVLQAISLAEGVSPGSAPQRAKVLRVTPGLALRSEIPVDVKKILAGQSTDIPLQRDDILFIPNALAKRAAIRALEMALQTGSGLLIYRTAR